MPNRSGTKPRPVDDEYRDEIGGYNAWMNGDEAERQPDVQDVQDVPHVSDARDRKRAEQRSKVARIAGPKWSPELLQQARDAVLALRSHGRPTMTLTEALDEAMTAWLRDRYDEYNDGQAFPSRGGLRG